MAKKHGHEAKHAHCEHCLHACDHCEVAYCCDCNKEWGACRQQHGYPWYTYTTPIYSTTTISPNYDSITVSGISDHGATASDTYSVNDHAHAHN